MALRLKRSGVRWVHPLHGGLAAWIDAGLPVEEITAIVEDRATQGARGCRLRSPQL